MKTVEMSIFYNGGLCSYSIEFNGQGFYHFRLISTPPGKKAPLQFSVTHTPGKWLFNPEQDKELKRATKAIILLINNR